MNISGNRASQRVGEKENCLSIGSEVPHARPRSRLSLCSYNGPRGIDALHNQLSSEGSKPGGGQPILIRWRRIFFTSAELVMTASTRIFEEQRGQIDGLPQRATRTAGAQAIELPDQGEDERGNRSEQLLVMSKEDSEGLGNREDELPVREGEEELLVKVFGEQRRCSCPPWG